MHKQQSAVDVNILTTGYYPDHYILLFLTKDFVQ